MVPALPEMSVSSHAAVAAPGPVQPGSRSVAGDRTDRRRDRCRGRKASPYCYDHLGGRLAVGLMDSLLEREVIVGGDGARSRAVMERIGMRYVGEIRSRGMAEGAEGEQDDAPFAVCVLLRRDWDRFPAAPAGA